MEFLDLFLIALMPVLKVILVTALGLFLALDEIDLLGPNARHHLNNVSFEPTKYKMLQVFCLYMFLNLGFLQPLTLVDLCKSHGSSVSL